jgi:hypothetical protein
MNLDLTNHPFTALATIANDALQKGDHASHMLRNSLLAARETETANNSSSFKIKSITADERVKFAKASKQIERKQKGRNRHLQEIFYQPLPKLKNPLMTPSQIFYSLFRC